MNNSREIDYEARSSWSSMNGVEEISLYPSHDEIDGEVVLPGSKSLTNRALIISAAAQGISKIEGILKSDDSYWCIKALQNLGININVQDNKAKVESNHFNSGKVYVGSAGTAARFLPGLLASSPGGEWEVTASENMNRRPIGPLVDILRRLGAEISYLNEENHYPIFIRGREIMGGKVKMSGDVSSQFISGLLIAAPYFKKSLILLMEGDIVQKNYVKMTLDLMENFGADVVYDDGLKCIKVNPSIYKNKNIELEADISSACYFLALAAITNGKVRINCVNNETIQPDIGMLKILEKMGCQIIRGAQYIELKGPRHLKGNFEVSMKEMSDQALTLAAIAPFLDGPLIVKNVGHIRHHESDRIKAICTSMNKMNIKNEEFEDGFKIYPGDPSPATLETYDDHRVAMSLALIGAKVLGIKLKDPGCVSKTFPNYFTMLESMGVRCERK
jgi:3-phosphoshikimate 1-carboxyvinyltransferase